MAGTFAARFLDWFNFDITIEPWSGAFDAYGQPLYSAPQLYKCYVEDKVRMVRDSLGNEKVSTTTLYIYGGPFDVHDRVTLPAGFRGPSQPPVITVNNVNDKSGFDHSEIYL